MKKTMTKETTGQVKELIEIALENGWSEEDLHRLAMKGPKEKVIDIHFEVRGTKELSAKVEKVAALLEEANALLNDVAQNSGIEVVAKSSVPK